MMLRPTTPKVDKDQGDLRMNSGRCLFRDTIHVLS